VNTHLLATHTQELPKTEHTSTLHKLFAVLGTKKGSTSQIFDLRNKRMICLPSLPVATRNWKTASKEQGELVRIIVII
jgi:hypothetical protein